MVSLITGRRDWKTSAQNECRSRAEGGGNAIKAGSATRSDIKPRNAGSLRRERAKLMSVVDLVQLRCRVPEGRRLLGLDVGAKTIGLALSDATWSVASPVRTLPRSRLAKDLEALRALVSELEVGGLVIGLPVEMNGREGPRCQSVRQFARNLLPVLPLPTAFWDERLSTEAVERFLIGEADLSRERRRTVIDRAAAAWILQGALDALNHARQSGPSDNSE
jgi:putative holliday junction resolvase